MWTGVFIGGRTDHRMDILHRITSDGSLTNSTDETRDGRRFMESQIGNKHNMSNNLDSDNFQSNAQVDTRDSSRCVPRLVRLFGFLFGVSCWVGFPAVLLLPATGIIISGNVGLLFWGTYFGFWLLSSLWWFICFRWKPMKFFIETYAD